MIISWSVFALIYRFQSPQKWTPRIEKRACKSHQNKMICQPHPVSCDGNKRPFRNSQPIQPVHFCGGSNTPWTSSSWKSGLESGYIWILYIWMSCSNSTLKFVGRWETSLSYPTLPNHSTGPFFDHSGPRRWAGIVWVSWTREELPSGTWAFFAAIVAAVVAYNGTFIVWLGKTQMWWEFTWIYGITMITTTFWNRVKKYSEIHHAENLRFLFPS